METPFFCPKDVPITDLFSCVRIEAGYETLSFDEETYEIKMIYSLKAFDAFTMRYLDCTFDWASLSAVDPNVSIDTENNKLAYVTYGAGGWGETAMESFTKVDDTHYSIRYYYHDYDNVPLYYGILNVKLTDKGFVIEAHLDAE